MMAITSVSSVVSRSTRFGSAQRVVQQRSQRLARCKVRALPPFHGVEVEATRQLLNVAPGHTPSEAVLITLTSFQQKLDALDPMLLEQSREFLVQSFNNAIAPFAIFGDHWSLNLCFLFSICVLSYSFIVQAPKQ